MFKNYISTAWRNIKRHKMTSLINFTGLMVGMVSAFLIFLWVGSELSYDRNYPDADSMYRLTSHSIKYDVKSERTPYLLGEDIKSKIPEIKELTRMYPVTYRTPTVKVGESFWNEKSAVHVDEQWFDFFGYRFISGSALNFGKHPYSVILSESKAQLYFGRTTVAGEILELDGHEYLIRGVVEEEPSSSLRYGCFLPVSARHLDRFYEKMDLDPIRNFYHTFLKLEKTSSKDLATSKMEAILHEDYRNNYYISLFPLKDMHFEEGVGHAVIQRGDRKLTYMMMALGGLLLTIACINYVNLTTARATTRSREVGIRKIIGADRRQLFFQFVCESALIGLTALAASLVMIHQILPLLGQFVEYPLTFSLSNPMVWQVLGGTFLTAVLLTSVYPAVMLSGFEPVKALKGKRSGSRSGLSLRKSLVVIQFSFSLILVVGSLVIYKQMHLISQKNDHYDKSLVFSIQFPVELAGEGDLVTRMERIKQQLLSHSAVAGVSIGRSAVKVENLWSGFEWEGMDPGVDYGITYMLADADYARLLNLELLEGRWFSPDEKSDGRLFVLNETAVKDLQIRKPVVGQYFMHDGDTGRIVGVVKDFHFLSVREQISPLVINNKTDISLLVKSGEGNYAAAISAAERIFKEVVQDKPFDYRFDSEEFDQLYRTESNVGTLIYVFSTLAIFVSCLGLYGLAAFSAEQRLKEIGIRKVLGAKESNIITMLTSDFGKLVGLAIVLATPVAWWVSSRWLHDFAYRIELQWWIFVMAGGGTLIVALLTVSYQAIKAALKNPVKSLGSE